MITAYQRERDRWLSTRGAVQAVRVRALLDQERVGLDRTEATLGYRLRQHHMGLISWVPGWVWLVLGALANDDEPSERLRETLRVFLAAKGSYVAAGNRLTLH
jgi:hypothetical protein